jgi:beta-xylosidase
MWFHYDRSGYGDSRGGVAIADHPAGPWKYLGQQRPIESSTFRDMGTFVDDDGRAYVFYSGEENQTMHVVRLNAEWTGPEMPMVEDKTWARILRGRARESPSPFKHEGKYYLITSGTTGWAPNPGDLAVADNPLGPYKQLGNPFRGEEARTSHRSQSTFVIPDPSRPAGNFIYLGDRWKPEALADARYVWLPFKMDGENTKIDWHERWSLAAPAR